MIYYDMYANRFHGPVETCSAERGIHVLSHYLMLYIDVIFVSFCYFVIYLLD